MKLGPLVCALSSVLMVVCGCATPYRAMSLRDVDPAHSRSHHQKSDGFIVAASLVNEGTLSRALFFHSLPDRNLFPVVLFFENAGERAVVFSLHELRLNLDDGSTIVPEKTEAVIREASLSARRAYLGLPLVFPYYWARRSIEEFNFELDRDYRQKALPEFLRITPGDPPSARVVFFHVEDSAVPLLEESPVVEVPVDFEAFEEGGRVIPGRRYRFLVVPE